MNWTAILVGVALLAIILLVAWLFARHEQASAPTGPVDLDPDERQRRIESASSITIVGDGSGPGIL